MGQPIYLTPSLYWNIVKEKLVKKKFTTDYHFHSQEIALLCLLNWPAWLNKKKSKIQISWVGWSTSLFPFQYFPQHFSDFAKWRCHLKLCISQPCWIQYGRTEMEEQMQYRKTQLYGLRSDLLSSWNDFTGGKPPEKGLFSQQRGICLWFPKSSSVHFSVANSRKANLFRPLCKIHLWHNHWFLKLSSVLFSGANSPKSILQNFPPRHCQSGNLEMVMAWPWVFKNIARVPTAYLIFSFFLHRYIFWLNTATKLILRQTA